MTIQLLLTGKKWICCKHVKLVFLFIPMTNIIIFIIFIFILENSGYVVISCFHIGLSCRISWNFIPPCGFYEQGLGIKVFNRVVAQLRIGEHVSRYEVCYFRVRHKTMCLEFLIFQQEFVTFWVECQIFWGPVASQRNAAVLRVCNRG